MPRKKKEVKNDYIQLELIPLTELEKIYKEFTEVKESSDKVRRGIFAKNTDLAKKVDVLTCEIESLKAQLITMNEWIISRLGSVEIAEKNMELQETTSLHITKINVMFAEKLHPLHTQEIMDIQSFSA